LPTDRQKLNESVSSTVTYRRGDLYRQFIPAFKVLLSPTPLAIDTLDGNAGYVPNTEIEERLLYFSQLSSSHLNEFVGETGIGKSTYIRKVFGANKNPSIKNDVLYVPFFLNGQEINNHNIRQKFISTLKAAYTECQKYYMALREKDFDDIYSFISSHNQALLELGDFFEPSNNTSALKSLSERNPYAFFAELLKYACDKTSLKQIVVIYDDIESIADSDTILSYVRQLCNFHTCFMNVEDKSFSISSIIAIRPSTRRLLQSTHWYRAYTANDSLIITNPSALADIFVARVSYLTRREVGKLYKDIDRINEATAVLTDVVSKFEQKTLFLLSELSNHNIREAIRLFASVVSNRRYVQHDAALRPHFTVKTSDYSINGGSVARSIILDEADVYVDHNSSVFNLFKNSRDKRSDLIVAYICKYFFNNNSKRWENLERISEREFMSDIALVCRDTSFLEYSLEYLRKEKVIESFSVTDHGQATTYFMALPRLFGAISLLEMNSVYLDAMRDDAYLPSSVLSVHGAPVAPVSRLKSTEEKIDASVAMLEHIFRSECDILNRVMPSEQSVLRRKFGDTLVASSAARGLRKTIFASGQANRREFLRLEADIAKFERDFGGE